MGKIRPKPLSPGAIVGRRVSEERKRQGLSQDEVVARLAKLGRISKKSEVLRAGLKVLAALSDASLTRALDAVPSIKTGRPKGKGKPSNGA